MEFFFYVANEMQIKHNTFTGTTESFKKKTKANAWTRYKNDDKIKLFAVDILSLPIKLI